VTDLGTWLLLGVAVLLIAANALFVAAEFAFVTVDRSRLETRAADDRAARRAVQALGHLSTQLSGAQLGITVTSLLVGFLAEPALAELMRPWLRDLGLSDSSVTAVSLGLALAFATAAQMIFGELVPKNGAIASPVAVARATAGPMLGFTRVTGPLLRVLNGSANRIVRAVGIEPTEELSSARSAPELRSLVRQSAREGTLDQGVANVLERGLAFSDRTAEQVMTPRPRVDTVTADLPVAKVVALLRTTGHARFPVIGSEGVDDVVGVVDLRRVLRVDPSHARDVRVRSVMAPPLFVPSTTPLDDLLDQLREQSPLAVVVDEYGGTAGVVSLEDLVEELVGDVLDEHDAHETPAVRRRQDGSLLLSGLVRTDEAREVGLPLQDDPAYDTIGGWFAARLGRLPGLGDRAEVGDWGLTVTRMDGRRVDQVTARPRRKPTDE
jgi:CBS domain containing-hemolysin-like protein